MLLMKRWWCFMRLIMNLHEDINFNPNFLNLEVQ